MSRADAFAVVMAARAESKSVYLGLDYAAYCVGIRKADREALAAQVSALMGPLVRWKRVPIIHAGGEES